ncbi:MAG: bifunctional DNA primase/polymerase [Thermoanaerobaculia bacterium]|nr:bifunctional DNA primase/polymerase [Thermoanaerobaculia bacterium]
MSRRRKSRRPRRDNDRRPRSRIHHLSEQARPFLEAALACAGQDFKVIPCARTERIHGTWVCSCPDVVCRSPGRHPINIGGVHSGTTNPKRIARWAQIPYANLGFVVPPGFAVLDVGSVDALQHFGDQGLALPDTVCQRTPRGGFHFLFELPTCTKLRVGECSRVPGARLLTEGSYILIAPSRGPQGGEYEWLVPLERSRVAPAPDWLIAHFLAPDSPRNPLSAMTRASQVGSQAVVLAFPCKSSDEGDLR